jgi:hypothetical protein
MDPAEQVSPIPHLSTETDSVSETLCSLEYWKMDKIKKKAKPIELCFP